MKKLFTYLLSLCATVSCLQEERSPEEILVPTLTQVESTESSLMFTSKVPKGSEKLVEECGFYYGTDKSMADATKIEASMDVNNFAVQLPERNYGTTYYICSYITNGHGSEIRSDVSSYSLKTLDEYVNFGKVNIDTYEPISKQLSIKFEIEIEPIVEISQIGVCYGEKSTGLTVDGDYVKGKIYEDGYVTILINGLESETQYYLRPYLKDGKYISYDDAQSFVIPSIPVAVTSGVDNVTSESAELSGEIVSGSDILERGFVWTSGQSVPTIDSYKIKVDGTLGKYTATLTGLTPGVKYAFRSYVRNNQGAFYGDILNFTTVAGASTLSVTKVTDITETSATFTSKVISDGGSAPTEVGFYYSKEESVNVETAQKVSETFSSDNFTLSVSDLEVGTTYYVKAFALNSVGETYNSIVNFKTVSTAPSVITSGASTLTATSAELSGEVADDNGETITERGFVWMKGQGTPTTSGNRIQVIGTTGELSSTLENLEPNQTYSFRAYAVNSKGTSYGETLTFKTEVALPVVEFTGCSDVTSSSAVVSGSVTYHGGETVSEAGFLYGTTPVLDPSIASKVKSAYSGDSFSFTLSGLTRAQNYYVQPFATNSKGTSYGDVTMFTTLPDLPTVTTNGVTNISDNGAVSGGTITSDGGGEILAKGVVWSRSKNPTVESSFKTDEGIGVDSFTSYLTDLTPGRTYYVRAYATNAVGTAYGVEQEFKTTGETPFETLDPANSFIVSESGIYAFEPVKGNSFESVGIVASAEVLWESFGTSETPEIGSLVSSVSVEGAWIVFDVPEPYREGNAVIAAKDANSTILWSWHIWLTDQPQEQVYFNNAGTLMDRNLGATSATPGDVGALGLLYQWGRKDPFLGSSSIHNDSIEVAKSTLSWPSAVSSSSSAGTVDYVTAHPTTYVYGVQSTHNDWQYIQDDTLWQSVKTIYDPCPAGWRVPDGGDNGVWSTASGSSSGYNRTYDSTNEGMNFSGDFGSSSTIWYPASGYRYSNDGVLSNVRYYGGSYWSVSPHGVHAYYLYFRYDGTVFPTLTDFRAYGFSVRCLQESE